MNSSHMINLRKSLDSDLRKMCSAGDSWSCRYAECAVKS